MDYTNRITQTVRPVKTVEAILKGACPACGNELDVITRSRDDADHFFVTCCRGGWQHLLVEIDSELAMEYDDFANWMENEFTGHEENIEWTN